MWQNEPRRRDVKHRLIVLFGLLAFVAGLMSPRILNAQSAASATVVGTVSDQSGAILPAVSIKLTNVGTSVSLTTTSNESGQYTFPTVTPGTYTLAVTKSGFKNATVSNLTVDIAKSYTVNVSMQVGEVSQSVTVEAGANVQLETTTAQVSGTVTSTEMD